MQTKSNRFLGPTAGLDLKYLNRKARPILWCSLIIAAVIHTVVLFQSIDFGRKDRVAKPLTMRFIQRAPRLTKPLELRKRPTPRKREMTRQKVNIQAKSPQLLTTYVGGIGISSLATGIGSLEKSWSGDMGLKMAAPELVIATAKEPEHKIDMEASLLRLEDLDTGRYKAMVIQNPDDKRKIRGYFHIAELMSPSMLERSVSRLTGTAAVALFDNEHSLKCIAEAMNTYTDIRVDYGRRVAMADKELLDIPWVAITTTRAFYPTESEKENLGRYFIAGGFLFIDAGGSIGNACDLNRRDLIKQALAKVGRSCHFYRLAKDHPIFHAYYDFDVVPTAGASGGYASGRSDLNSPEYLIGVDVDGRLATVLSYVSFMSRLNNTNAYGRDEAETGHTQRLLQFMVNTIVFALTQEGSITNRVMEMIK